MGLTGGVISIADGMGVDVPGCAVEVDVGVNVSSTCSALLRLVCISPAFAWTAKMPIDPGNPIPSIKMTASIEWRFLARIDSYLVASWLVTLFQVCDGTAGGMALYVS